MSDDESNVYIVDEFNLIVSHAVYGEVAQAEEKRKKEREAAERLRVLHQNAAQNKHPTLSINELVLKLDGPTAEERRIKLGQRYDELHKEAQIAVQKKEKKHEITAQFQAPDLKYPIE